MMVAVRTLINCVQKKCLMIIKIETLNQKISKIALTN
jgi:hypothetical protein